MDKKVTKSKEGWEVMTDWSEGYYCVVRDEKHRCFASGGADTRLGAARLALRRARAGEWTYFSEC